MPTAAELDQATERHPVLVKRGGHNDVVNTYALSLAGITEDTPTPPGGVIGRDADGRLNGWLIDNALPLAERFVPGQAGLHDHGVGVGGGAAGICRRRGHRVAGLCLPDILLVIAGVDRGARAAADGNRGKRGDDRHHGDQRLDAVAAANQRVSAKGGDDPHPERMAHERVHSDNSCGSAQSMTPSSSQAPLVVQSPKAHRELFVVTMRAHHMRGIIDAQWSADLSLGVRR